MKPLKSITAALALTSAVLASGCVSPAVPAGPAAPQASSAEVPLAKPGTPAQPAGAPALPRVAGDVTDAPSLERALRVNDAEVLLGRTENRAAARAYIDALAVAAATADDTLVAAALANLKSVEARHVAVLAERTRLRALLGVMKSQEITQVNDVGARTTFISSVAWRLYANSLNVEAEISRASEAARLASPAVSEPLKNLATVLAQTREVNRPGRVRPSEVEAITLVINDWKARYPQWRTALETWLAQQQADADAFSALADEGATLEGVLLAALSSERDLAGPGVASANAFAAVRQRSEVTFSARHDLERRFRTGETLFATLKEAEADAERTAYPQIADFAGAVRDGMAEARADEAMALMIASLDGGVASLTQVDHAEMGEAYHAAFLGTAGQVQALMGGAALSFKYRDMVLNKREGVMTPGAPYDLDRAQAEIARLRL